MMINASAEQLHLAVDRLVEQKAKGMTVAAIADDMEFLRRASQSSQRFSRLLVRLD